MLSEVTHDRFLQLRDHVVGADRLDREPPSRHQSKSSQSGSDSEGSLPSELDGDETERLVS